MSLLAMQSTDAGAQGVAPTKLSRPLRVLAARLRQDWPTIRAARSFHIVSRALGVGGVLSLIFVLALTAQPDDVFRPLEKSARNRPRVPASPFMTLSRVGDDFALDGDFSLERAMDSWSRRKEIDPPGTLRFGSVRVAESIVAHVVQAAKTTDTDPALLMAIADKESSFSPSAKASTSSASGLFQFVEATWFKAVKNFGWRYGQEEAAKAIGGDEGERSVSRDLRAKILKLRNDPYLSAVLAAEMLKKDGAKIAEKLGRALTAGETYLIHFLGPNDAERFMAKMQEEPNASAAELLPKPARANKPIFYETQGRKLKDRSLTEVHEAFEHMMGTRASRYQDVEAKLPAGVMAYAEGAAPAAAAKAPEPAAAPKAAQDEPAAAREAREQQSAPAVDAPPRGKPEVARLEEKKAEGEKVAKKVALSKAELKKAEADRKREARKVALSKAEARSARRHPDRNVTKVAASSAHGARIRLTLPARGPAKAAHAARVKFARR